MKHELNLGLVRFIDKQAGAVLIRLLALFMPSDGLAPPPPPGDVRKILLMKFYGVGNLVMILPVIRVLRRRFPQAEIDFLTLESNAGIISGAEEIRACHFLEHGSPLVFILSALKSLPELRRRGYDLIIDFEQFAKVSAILSALIGAPRRIGFSNPAQNRDLLYTTRVSYLDFAHMRHIFMRLAQAAGADTNGPVSGRIAIGPEHLREAADLERAAGIREEDTLVIIHPGTSEHLIIRRWPPERFAELADRLIERHGVKVVVTGSPAEQELAGSLVKAMKHPAHNAVGTLSVKGLTALLERAELVVSNDTAPVHIASAMGTPVVGIYGPNTPFLYGPTGKDDLVFYRDLFCSPCMVNINAKLSHCRRPRCIDLITTAEVAAAVTEKYFGAGGGIRPEFKKHRPRPEAVPEGAVGRRP